MHKAGYKVEARLLGEVSSLFKIAIGDAKYANELTSYYWRKYYSTPEPKRIPGRAFDATDPAAGNILAAAFMQKRRLEHGG